MHVLVVSQARYGVRNVIESLLVELAASDEITPAYLTIPTHDAPDGVEQVSLLSESRLQRYEGHRLRYLGYAVLNFWRRAYTWLGTNGDRYDVVWFHNPRLLPLLPADLTDRLLVTFHNHLLSTVARHYDRPARWYYRVFGALERRGLRKATDAWYTVVNPAVVEELRACGIPGSRVRYVENGVDTDTFRSDYDTSEVVEKYDLPTEVPLLLFLGRLKGQKRPELLVERFADVSAALDGDVALAVAGKGARGEAARRVAQRRELDNVRFLGYVPEAEKAPLYAAADYFRVDDSPWSDAERRNPPDNSPVSPDVPAEDTPLFDFLSERLFDSFRSTNANPRGALIYKRLMNVPNTGGSRESRNEVMNEHWHDHIKPTLDDGRLCPLGLIHINTHNQLFHTGLNQIGDNHQVLAYGYKQSGGHVEIYVYDPNHPRNDEKRIEFTHHDNLSNWFAPNYVGDDDLFAFFAVSYSLKDPPDFKFWYDHAYLSLAAGLEWAVLEEIEEPVADAGSPP